MVSLLSSSEVCASLACPPWGNASVPLVAVGLMVETLIIIIAGRSCWCAPRTTAALAHIHIPACTEELHGCATQTERQINVHSQRELFASGLSVLGGDPETWAEARVQPEPEKKTTSPPSSPSQPHHQPQTGNAPVYFDLSSTVRSESSSLEASGSPSPPSLASSGACWTQPTAHRWLWLCQTGDCTGSPSIQRFSPFPGSPPPATDKRRDERLNRKNDRKRWIPQTTDMALNIWRFGWSESNREVALRYMFSYLEWPRRCFLLFAWHEFGVLPGLPQPLNHRGLHKHDKWLEFGRPQVFDHLNRGKGTSTLNSRHTKKK